MLNNPILLEPIDIAREWLAVSEFRISEFTRDLAISELQAETPTDTDGDGDAATTSRLTTTPDSKMLSAKALGKQPMTHEPELHAPSEVASSTYVDIPDTLGMRSDRM